MQRTLTSIAMLSCIATASAQSARATDAATDAPRWPLVASVLRYPRCRLAAF